MSVMQPKKNLHQQADAAVAVAVVVDAAAETAVIVVAAAAEAVVAVVTNRV